TAGDRRAVAADVRRGRQRTGAGRIPGNPAASRQARHGERLMAAPDDTTRPPRAPADDEAFKRELVQLIPHLRAFARTLCGDPAAADDLAQDAMMKAWDARASFQMGTNMKAWTFMIL